MLADVDFACHFHCFRNQPATEEVLRRFRGVYPTARIHLISDGGADFRPTAEKYGCAYHHEPWNIGLQIKVSLSRMHEWFRRFLYACHESTEPWILILEDDVWVRHQMQDPKFPMTGNHAGGRIWKRPIGSYIFKRQPHLKNLGYGGGGGTLIDRTLAIKAIAHYLACENFGRWTEMARMNASDVWLTGMMMLQGHQYGPNQDLAEVGRHPRWRESDCAIIHQIKDWTGL